MSEYIETQWVRLRELECRLQEAIRTIAHNEHVKRPGIVKLPEYLLEPVWEITKKSIRSKLMIWQIAYLYYPLTDPVKTRNPRYSGSFFSKRIYFMYQLLELVGTGMIRGYELPPTIQDDRCMLLASIEDKVRIRLDIESVKTAFRCGYLSALKSPVIKIWEAYICVKKPGLKFLACPDEVHVVGEYPGFVSFVYVGVDGFECQEVDYSSDNISADDKAMIDSYEYWEKNHYESSFELDDFFVDYLLSNLRSERVVKVIKYGECGEPPEWEMSLEEYETLNQSMEGGELAPDGLPIPWLLKTAKRKRQLPGQMIESAYKLFRGQNGRNHETPDELFFLLTPEYLPEFIGWRNTQVRPSSVKIKFVDGVEWDYQNFLSNYKKMFFTKLKDSS